MYVPYSRPDVSAAAAACKGNGNGKWDVISKELQQMHTYKCISFRILFFLLLQTQFSIQAALNKIVCRDYHFKRHDWRCQITKYWLEKLSLKNTELALTPSEDNDPCLLNGLGNLSSRMGPPKSNSELVSLVSKEDLEATEDSRSSRWRTAGDGEPDLLDSSLTRSSGKSKEEKKGNGLI